MTTSQFQRRPVEILLVEDNPVDQRLTQDAFKQARVENRIHIAEDGVEAMEFLRQEGEHRYAPRPDLILLDLNMPRMDGREVLAELEKDKSLRRIPVIVMTVSKSEEDVLAAYDLHANSYVSKPVEMGDFLDVVRSLEGFWLSVVRFPHKEMD